MEVSLRKTKWRRIIKISGGEQNNAERTGTMYKEAKTYDCDKDHLILDKMVMQGFKEKMTDLD